MTPDPGDKHIVPPQLKGSSTGAGHHIECADREAAITLFHKAMQRLLDINNWHEISGPGSARFQLTDEEGNPAHIAVMGHLIRIDIPGPGTIRGGGYDWVRIEALQHVHDAGADEDWFAFRVRPCNKPGASAGDSAHFYTSEATSTFIIKRMKHHLTAAEGGRNEIPNTRRGNLFDRLRNAFVGSTASKGFAYPQWKNLVKGVLETDS